MNKLDVLLKRKHSEEESQKTSVADFYHPTEGEQKEDEGTESVFDFLARQQLDSNGGNRAQPFCLVASLVNPHDVWASSCFSKLSDEEFYRETGYHPRDFESIPIDLPRSHNDDLSSKPSIQTLLRSHPVFGDLSTVIGNDQLTSDALRYIRFYAYLHKCVDDEIGSLLDELHATGQMDNTVIIRLADHGELGLCHAMR